MPEISSSLLKFALFAALLTTLAGSGCVTVRQTDPAHSATEELLLSTAADRAAAKAGLSEFCGKKVYLDGSYCEGTDAKYALGAIRDALSQAGALLMPGIELSEITIEARSGALSTDNRKALLGVPASGLPVPLIGTVAIPELSVYKSEAQTAIAKLALLAYSTKSRKHIVSSGPMVGRAYDKSFKIIFVSIHRTDIPEKEKERKQVKAEEKKREQR